jgi:hypothetical protein
MSEKPICELRCRMLEDMALRKFSEATRHNYIRHIAAFAKLLRRSPDTPIRPVDRGRGLWSKSATRSDRRRQGMLMMPATLGGTFCCGRIHLFFLMASQATERTRHAGLGPSAAG